MRIIGGSAGGRTLRAPRGLATRPTADRVREAIFNILCARGPVPARVLDLYAGSGALGLEAASRGAEQSVLVDEDRDTCTLITDNARTLGLAAACQVVAARTVDFLRRAEGRFGWVFLDPPYAHAAREVPRALALLDERRLVDDGGVAVVEHDWHYQPGAAHGALALADARRYGQTGVSFYSREATS